MKLNAVKLAALSASATVLERLGGYTTRMEAIKQTELAIASRQTGTEHALESLWGQHYCPLIRDAMADDTLTLSDWNSLFAGTVEQIEGLPSTLKNYNSTAKNAVPNLKGKFAAMFYAQQVEAAAEVADPTTVKYQEPLDFTKTETVEVDGEQVERLIPVPFKAVREVMAGITKVANASLNPLETDAGKAIAELTKQAKEYTKASKYSAESIANVRALIALLEVPVQAKGEEPVTLPTSAPVVGEVAQAA